MTDAEALAAIGSIGAGSSPGTLTDDQALAAINSIGAAQSNITTPQSVPQPQGAAPAPVSDPSAGMSPFQLYAAGLGKGAMDLFRGTRNAVTDALAGPPFAPTELKDLSAQWRKESDQIKAQDAPLMKSVMAQAGNFTAQAAPGFALPLGGLSALGRIGASTLFGAGQGAVQPVGVNDSRGANTLLGAGLGAAGQGLANGIGMVARGAVPASPTVQAAMDFAKPNGGVLTRGQISGNPWTGRLEKIAASLPGSQKFFANAALANRNAATTGLEAVTGGNAGKMIQNAGAGLSLNMDQPFFGDMGAIGNNFASLADRDAPYGALKTVEQYIGSQTPNPALAGLSPTAKAQAIAQGVPEFAGGAVPKFKAGDSIPMVGPYGDFNNYQALRSLYGGRAVGGGDPTDKAAYALIQDAFDNAAQRSLAAQGVDPATMQAVQHAYAVQKIAQPARSVDAAGAVTYDPSKLSSAVARTDTQRPGMIGNLGDAGQQLRNLAAFGAVTRPLSSSGTTENALAGHMMTGGLMAGGLGELLSAGGMHHLGAGIAGLLLAPKLINSAIQGTRNGIPILRDASPTMQNALLRAGAGLPLGLLGLSQ